jgi:hypothetical protein
MLLELLQDYDWILCGDFNMVETKEDKTSTYSIILSDNKKETWDKLKNALDIEEPEHLKKVSCIFGTTKDIKGMNSFQIGHVLHGERKNMLGA